MTEGGRLERYEDVLAGINIAACFKVCTYDIQGQCGSRQESSDANCDLEQMHFGRNMLEQGQSCREIGKQGNIILPVLRYRHTSHRLSAKAGYLSSCTFDTQSIRASQAMSRSDRQR